uniref:Uncharacterized protein n=1 Tax=Meleagris gallopavo TaxID=9103 RepID=A0A803YIY1_MELGA
SLGSHPHLLTHPFGWLKSAGSCRSGLRHPWNRSSVEKNKTEKMRFLILFIFAKRREESSLKSPALRRRFLCLGKVLNSLVQPKAANVSGSCQGLTHAIVNAVHRMAWFERDLKPH